MAGPRPAARAMVGGHRAALEGDHEGPREAAAGWLAAGQPPVARARGAGHRADREEDRVGPRAPAVAYPSPLPPMAAGGGLPRTPCWQGRGSGRPRASRARGSQGGGADVSGARILLERAAGVRVAAPVPRKAARLPWAPGRPAVAMSSSKGKLGRPVEVAGVARRRQEVARGRLSGPNRPVVAVAVARGQRGAPGRAGNWAGAQDCPWGLAVAPGFQHP